jgi:hypothetical protein
MDLKGEVARFLVRIVLYSFILACLIYAAIHLEFLQLSIQAALSIQSFVLLVTVAVHVFLMRSATAEIRVQQFMFNFLLATTIKIFIYSGSFGILVYLGGDIFGDQYTNLTLFLTLFGFYLLYTVFEVVLIKQFLSKLD